MAKWSYSSLSLFEQCPKKFYHLRVAKDIVEPPSDQMRYGLMAHEAAEKYIRDGTPLPPAFTYMQEALDRLRTYKEDEGLILCEYKMGVTEDLEPCDFNDPEVWWRGIADLLVVNGPTCRAVDYKTGKSQYADLKQLELLSLAVFRHFPAVNVSKAGLLFVVHPAFVKAKYLRDEEQMRWQKWKAKVWVMDEAFASNVWNPKQNFTCNGWCPVVDCHHWSPRRR
jgi:hypothetical protein